MMEPKMGKIYNPDAIVATGKSLQDTSPVCVSCCQLRAALAASQERVQQLDRVAGAARKLHAALTGLELAEHGFFYLINNVDEALSALTPEPARDGRKEKP